jgi:hypothetical protein
MARGRKAVRFWRIAGRHGKFSSQPRVVMR